MLLKFVRRSHVPSVRPKSAGSTVVSLFPSSPPKARKSRAGNRPRAFQLETADGPTPAIRAAASAPIASITASTDVKTIPEHTSQPVSMSSAHTLGVAVIAVGGILEAMKQPLKVVARRLEVTAHALGKTGADIGRDTGIKSNAWTQFTDPKYKRYLTLDAAIRLCDKYGLTLEWLYRGNPKDLPREFLEKIASQDVA